MSEWLKEDAWKAKPSTDTEPLRGTSTHTRSASQPSKTIPQCASVDPDLLRRFEADVSQSYHNAPIELRGWRRKVNLDALARVWRWRSTRMGRRSDRLLSIRVHSARHDRDTGR